MKNTTLKRMLIATTTLVAVLAAPMQSMAAFSYPEYPKGTAYFDYVFATDGEETIDFTDEAMDMEDGDVEFFISDDEDEAEFYLGMAGARFDRVYFNLEDALVLEDEDAEAIWEYYDGDDWVELDVEANRSGGLSTVNTRYVDFEMPMDWEKTEVNEEEGYFVRVLPGDDVDATAVAEEMSARAYTFEIRLKNTNGDEIENLDIKEFDLKKGSNNGIYGMIELGDGAYLFATQSEGDDNTFTFEVNAEQYLSRGVYIEPDTDDVPVYSRTLQYRKDWMPLDEREYCPTPFVDIDNHWSQSTIRELYCKNVFEDKKYFHPKTSMDRAEFLKLLLEVAEVELDYDDEEVYGDVEEGDWHFEYVMTAYEMGIIDDARNFYPERSMDRAEAVAMAVRLAAEIADVNMDSDRTPFRDVSSFAWYASYVRTAYNYQVVVGFEDGTFQPNKTMSRAEGATVVNNFWYAFVRNNQFND